MSTLPQRVSDPDRSWPALTSLIGRDQELMHLRELLDDPSLRLVTIIGPGGVGKTRIAVDVASSLDGVFGDAITFVPLAAARDEALVLPGIADALGVVAARHDGTLADQVVAILGEHPWLIVLDNLEQVPGAASIVSSLLGACPLLTILATSRSPLGVAGEQLFALAPLPLPRRDDAPDAIRQADAVRLFVQRARAVNPSFPVDDDSVSAVAAICRRVDGLPLAIELAAARTNILSPNALLARLTNRLTVLGGGRRDMPERLRTMRDAIAWSYELLTPDEQVAFRHLAVFAGGFSLDAAEAIFSVVAPGQDALNLVGQLVDHSLVQPDHGTAEPRFLMLETIRDFGVDELAAEGEEVVARRGQATWVAGLVELAEPGLVGSDATAWRRRLDADVGNIRAALGWALAAGEDELGLRIATDTWRYIGAKGMLSEGRAWLDRALATGAGSGQLRAAAMVGAGYLAEYQRDLDASRRWFEEALALAESAGDAYILAGACIGLGTVAQDRGEYAEAIAHHERGAEIARAIGDRRVEAIALGNMANIAYFQGRMTDATRMLEACMESFTALGDEEKQALCASNLGGVLQESGDYASAAGYLEQALALQRQQGVERNLVITLVNLGQNALFRGDVARSRDAYLEALELARQLGNRQFEATATFGLALGASREGAIDAAAGFALEAVRLYGAVDDHLSIVETAELVASLYAERADFVVIIELLAAADAARLRLGADRHPENAREIAGVESAAREALDDESYALARERGGNLELAALARRVASLARELAGPSRPPITGAPARDSPTALSTSRLTAREREVLGLLVEGCSTEQIAEALFISPRTASTHIANMLGKLGVSSRTAAVSLALRSKLA